MRKILKVFFIIYLIIINISASFAYDPAVSPPPVKPSVPLSNTSTPPSTGTATPASTNTSGNTSGKVIKVKVTEKIPGANCTSASGSTDSKPLYNCSISPGFSSLKGMISEIIKFFTAIAALAGILFIVINGILLSMGSADSGKSSVKGRIVQGVVGLILLLMSGLILNLIAPWIYT